MHTIEPVKIKYPVCNGTLCGQLSNEQSVVEELIDDRDDLRITASKVIGACESDHYNDEDGEEFTLENLHPLVILLEIPFDNSGRCTAFDYLGIRPG